MSSIHTPSDRASPPDLGEDLLYGADAIGAYLFPALDPRRRRRATYHLASELPQVDRLPVFRLGAVICARKTTLLSWITQRETGGRAA
jgi:hypothetical protein